MATAAGQRRYRRHDMAKTVGEQKKLTVAIALPDEGDDE